MKRKIEAIGICGLILLVVFSGGCFESKEEPEMKIEIWGPNAIILNEPFNYTIKITNTGSCDLFNVNISDTNGFNWAGNLSEEDSKTFLIEYKGIIQEGEVIEVYAQGYSKNKKRISDATSWTIENILGGEYDLIEAMDKDIVSVRFRGTGYSSGDVIEMEIESNVEFSINIKIESGLILVNSGMGQNMIIGAFISLIIEPEVKVTVDIEAYCLDSNKDNPTGNESFSIQKESGIYGEEVQTLIGSLENVSYSKKSITAIQIAVWVLTENITENDITISYAERDIEDAKWLLQNAGIDISDRKLFQ